MRILLTGKNGQVGFELQRALAPLGPLVAFDQSECDLSDEKAVRRLVRAVRPDIIVNPAAYTAVDKAESDQDRAFAINGIAPAVLGEEAARLNALVVHYSTDYVFDGTKPTCYTEDDIANPLSVYGKSKLAGVQALLQNAKTSIIFRSSWVFGAHGNNFIKTMLRLASERDSLKVVADQFGAPTSAALIADITAHILRQYQQIKRNTFPFGLYNLVASGETNWCDLARTILAAALDAGKPLTLRPEDVLPISTGQYPLPAPRPANSRLETLRLRETFGLYLPRWQEGLYHVLQQIF